MTGLLPIRHPRRSPIAAYTDRLAQELRLPRFGREPDQITEVRDGLEDAAAALVRQGMNRRQAEQRAVDEFGEPAELARLFGMELGARRTFRSALLLAGLQPLLVGLWAGYAAVFPSHHTDWRSGASIGSAFTLVALVICTLAVAVALLLRIRAARPRLPARPIMVGLAGLSFAAVGSICGLALLTQNARPVGTGQAVAQSGLEAASNLILVAMLCAGVSAIRAARLARLGRR